MRMLALAILGGCGAALLGCDARDERPLAAEAPSRAFVAPKAPEPLPTFPVLLRAPPTDGARPLLRAGPQADEVPDATRRYPVYALAKTFREPLYQRPKRSATVLGWARAGQPLLARRLWAGRGCARGVWYRAEGGGFLCAGRDYRVMGERLARRRSERGPDVTRALPFVYAELGRRGVPRLNRPPHEGEVFPLPSEDGQRGKPAVVDRWLEGIFYFAFDYEDWDPANTWLRTTRGKYVRAEDLKPVEPPTFFGERLTEERTLPLAFVFEKEAPMYVSEENSAKQVGWAERFARFPLRMQDAHWAVADDGKFLPLSDVRVARRIARPNGIPARAKWVHVDLSEQTLVAYEGDTPVFATLVSTGREGYESPVGTYRVKRKYLSKTMTGRDDVEGYYEVEEVPWTLYYRGNYAIHGAYWHNEFGKTRSHGCTNVPPADARWLFYWSAPELPEGWHAMTGRKGSWVHYTL